MTKPETCFNIGLTYEGLRALGTPGSSLETFPTEFIEGMNSRALKLGDAGPSAPETWPTAFVSRLETRAVPVLDSPFGGADLPIRKRLHRLRM